MSDYSETVKVVSNNPEHGGYLVKNKSDMLDSDVIYGEKSVKKAEPVVVAEPKVAASDADEFENMSREDMLAYLTEKGETPHHKTGEDKLRASCRKVAADLV